MGSQRVGHDWATELNWTELAFKVKFPAGSQSLYQIPRLENLLWARELLQQYKNTFGVIVFQFVICLLSGYMVGLTRCTSQVHCSQNPCPKGRPLMIHASTGDAQTLECRSGSVTCGVRGACAHKVLFEPSEHLWWVCCLILHSILPLQPSCWGFSFALRPGVSFFDGIQHSPVNSCSAVSCYFGVLTGEDEHMSFYSAIFCQIHFEYRCWDLCFLMKILEEVYNFWEHYLVNDFLLFSKWVSAYLLIMFIDDKEFRWQNSDEKIIITHSGQV